MSATNEVDLKDVEVFITVAADGSFSRAARTLGLPTSTVSRRVSRLEDALGARLLHRTTRKLSLTDAGRLYFEGAARGLGEVRGAERAVTELRTSPRGKIRATAPVSVEGIDRLVTDFLLAFPEVEIEMDLTNRHVNLVEEGYDMALRAGEINDASLIAHHLADSGWALVASPAYLKKRGTPRTPRDLRDHDAVVYAPPGQHAVWNLRGTRVPVHGRISANHWSLIKQATLAGLGIANMPNLYCAEELSSGKLRAVLPRATPAPGGLYIVVPSRRHLSPAVRAWMEFLKERFARYITL